MDVSIIIPTFGRAQKLSRCLGRLAHQDYDHGRFEVLVGVDGRDHKHEPDDEATQAVHALASTSAGAMRAVVHEFDHAGPGATRNKLVEHARGRLLLLLNDDVLPEPDLISRHVAAHRELNERGVRGVGGAMVLGSAPWVKPTQGEDTLFDRLIRETSMIFFYDQMDAALAAGSVDADHDWGFRHAWTLNLSLSREQYVESGGFDTRLKYPCYEDLEFARRVAHGKSGGRRSPVVYRPAAIVRHDHRLYPQDYLRREAMMGKAAWEFAGACPECAQEVFGRDIRSDAEIEYSRAFVERERSTVDRLRESFVKLAEIPGGVVDAGVGGGGAHGAELIRLIYQQHLLLKRWVWRKALVEASAQVVVERPDRKNPARAP